MSDIEVEIVDRIATVTLNRPQRRNAMHLEMWRELVSLYRGFAADDGVRAVILTGAGDHFCAGADISEFETVRANAAQAIEYDRLVDECCDAIGDVPKPTIAAIRGFCIGGGSGLAVAHDFRIAHPDAVFAITAARLSIVYAVRETQALLALVGLANAKRILFTAERFDAEEATRIGFVDRVEADPVATARAFALTIAENAPLSIAGSKAILNGIARGVGALRDEVVREVIERAANSEDFQEGRRAFLEKRSPIFKGK
jgi:enoyl-CoA hydratase/carnithine racemase